MKRLFGISVLTSAVLLMSACGMGGEANDTDDSSSNRAGASTISFELPDGVSEVPDYEPTDGWTKSFSDNPSDPTVVIRVSDDLGRTAEADSTLGVIRGEAMFNKTYGEDFSPEKVSKLEVKNADVGVEASFKTKQEESNVNGTWMFVSNRKSEKVAGVEIIGTSVPPAMIDGIRESLEYTP
ncbi:hypothetical protein GCM10009585_01190 [Brevibacterium paucivorans]|uniref:hypothetical protein n=1 Tax=Brevibacterium paucivorans TaxID=170994 RepID=UPI0031CE913F